MQSTAEHSLPANFTPKAREQLFDEIVMLYDLTDEILASVAAEDATHRQEQLELLRPFITQITNSTNILSAFYTDIVRNGKPITADVKDTFNKAFQNVFTAYKELLDGVETKFLPGKQ